MPTKIVVPELGESVLEATVGQWRKREGDPVSPGEVVVELETDKVDLEVGAERAGVLSRIERKEGDDVRIGDVLGMIDEAPAGVATPSETAPPDKKPTAPPAVKPPESAPVLAPTESAPVAADEASTPSARRLAREQGVNLARVPLTDPASRVTRRDVEELIAIPAKQQPGEVRPSGDRAAEHHVSVARPREERVRMSRRRQTIAQRLVEAQHTAAILTTFNEIDMGSVMDLRRRRKDSFKARYGVSLGLTSFFVKAAITVLRSFPRLNAEIQGDEIVLKNYFDIGIAVGAREGLVVPVMRSADQMSFAQIEIAVKEFAQKAREGALTVADLRGGTFSVTNGGVFGSLLSTPILNPPQSGILGMHKVEERPVAIAGEVKIRPMMYVALSYDHRLVDGLEAVQFLVQVKDLIEDPGTLLIES